MSNTAPVETGTDYLKVLLWDASFPSYQTVDIAVLHVNGRVATYVGPQGHNIVEDPINGPVPTGEDRDKILWRIPREFIPFFYEALGEYLGEKKHKVDQLLVDAYLNERTRVDKFIDVMLKED